MAWRMSDTDRVRLMALIGIPIVPKEDETRMDAYATALGRIEGTVQVVLANLERIEPEGPEAQRATKELDETLNIF